MKRREFSLSLGAAAVLTACGGGGGGSDGGSGTDESGTPAPAPGETGPAPVALQFSIGTNLASMELGNAIRYGANTLPNINFAVPRQEDVTYLRDCGFKKNRLPIRWEMLQPVLHDTNANAATLATIGVSAPGEFHPGYEAFITQVLDEHAKAGTTCVLDLHNYCRYVDFVYQPDGSVIGLTKAPGAAQAFTTDSTQVQFRIFALAPGATLTIDNYVDLMTRIAKKWKGHPGLAGYGMMNEPNAMPKPGDTLGNDPTLPPGWNGQDLTIWPTFAAAGVKAIRAVDADTLIYLGGNNFSNAWGLGTENPGWPLNFEKIVYEVHCYLDATNSGQGANWKVQTDTKFSVGVDDFKAINDQTGVIRLQKAIDYAKAHNMALCLGETGMPADDPRWQQSWENMIRLAKANNIEVMSWAGGSHWQNRGQHVNNIPSWYQNKPVQSQQGGAMMAVAEEWKASIFDAGSGWAFDSSNNPFPVAITVYARGALKEAVTLTVTSDNGGTFSVGSTLTSGQATLTIPAGANGSATYIFTPKANAVTTLTYTGSSAPNLPPARKVYSLTDPVAYANASAANLADGAMAILAKYSACKWDLADGYTDPLLGAPCAPGDELRAVSDSGYGSSMGNEMEMVNWFNTSSGMGPFTTPRMDIANARKAADFTKDAQAFGLWCRKRVPIPLAADTRFTADPTPVEVVPYGLADPQFAIAAISIPSATSGMVFQAGAGNFSQFSALTLVDGKPQALWQDTASTKYAVSSPTALTAGTASTIAFVSDGNAQTLRVGSTVAATGAAALPAAEYDQMLLGCGFTDHYPRANFGGYLIAAVTGKGTPSADEMVVLESYLLLGTT